MDNIPKQQKALILAKTKGYKFENGNIISPKGKVLKLYLNSNGYYYFGIVLNRRTKTVKVHRLVAYYKFGDQLFEKGIVVRHLDGNPINNSFDNIAIGTHSDNMLDIPKEIRVKKARKAALKIRKFTKEQVDEIRKDRIEGASLNSLMKKYNCGKSTMYYIIKDDSFYKN